jgi:hypothetical protein
VPGLGQPVDAVRRTLARYSDHRAKQFDRKHGTDTFSRARMTELGCTDEVGKDFDGYMYGPINEDFFGEIARRVPDRAELTFCDVGMGKGLAMMLAHEWGFGRLLGVELSNVLVQIAQQNFERYRRSTGRTLEADVVCDDFMKYPLPERPTFFFLNNPFPHYLAERAVAHITSSLSAHPRRVVVAYRRAPTQTVAMLDAAPQLKVARRTPYWAMWESA